MTLRISILFLLLSHFAYSTKPAIAQDTLHRKVVSIANGDTFTFLLDNKTTIKVRLLSIDCPERKTPYSAVATKFISDAIFSKRVMVVVDSKDRYGRSLSRCIMMAKTSTRSFKYRD